MSDLATAAAEFLSLKRIAVAGVSRSGTAAANHIYRKLRGAGAEVFAVNPHAGAIEGDRCYPDVLSIPGGVQGVVIATHPDKAVATVEQCHEAGVRHVWLHRSFGQGSSSAEAILRCRELGMSVIPGGCPMMHCKPVDFGHKCLHWILKVTGGLPKPIRRV